MIRLKDLLTEQTQVKTTTFKQRFSKLRDAVKSLFKQQYGTADNTWVEISSGESFDKKKAEKYGTETATDVSSIYYSFKESAQANNNETYSEKYLSYSVLVGTFTKPEAKRVSTIIKFQDNGTLYEFGVFRYYLNNQLTDVLGQTQRDGSILSEVNTFDGAGSLQYSMPDEMRNAILEAFKDTNKHSEISKFITTI